MEDAVRIIGGSATGNSVSLYSDEFRVMARFNKKTETITSKTVKRNSLEKFLLLHPCMPPRTLAFTLQLLSMQSMRYFLLLAGVFVLLLGIMISVLLFAGIDNAEETSGSMEFILRIIRPFLPLFLLVVYRKYIAGFHAAEHMAISAYAQFGTSSVERIAEGSRFNPNCLGRFLIPGIVIAFITFFGLITLGELFLFVPIVLWEGILWVDTLVGLEKIPFTAKMTELLQRYVTTKPPSETELRTGQEALHQLLVAHEKLPARG